jgi:hypothetical protein
MSHWIDENAVAGYLRDFMKVAGVDIRQYTLHTIRVASSTFAVQLGHSKTEINIHANWSLNSNTFENCYCKPMAQESQGVKIFFYKCFPLLLRGVPHPSRNKSTSVREVHSFNQFRWDFQQRSESFLRRSNFLPVVKSCCKVDSVRNDTFGGRGRPNAYSHYTSEGSRDCPHPTTPSSVSARLRVDDGVHYNKKIPFFSLTCIGVRWSCCTNAECYWNSPLPTTAAPPSCTGRHCKSIIWGNTTNCNYWDTA